MLIWLLAILLSFIPAHIILAADYSPEEQYLIIHLDAVSTDTLYEAAASGEIPNILNFFATGHQITHGLSLFPGGTEVIYPRLKLGVDNSEHLNVGWSSYDRGQNRIIRNSETWLELASHFPRRSVSHFLYGLPVFDHLGGLALQNIPQLLQDYKVVEFFWFSTDTVGHAFGENSLRNSLRKFDHYFGKLTKKHDLSQINVILYCDHGMSMRDVYQYPVNDAVENLIPKEFILYYYYPNLYLVDPKLEIKRQLAQELATSTEIDFAFFKVQEDLILGFHQGGTVYFEQQEESFRYYFEGEDPFDYYEHGYLGQYLTADEWLLETTNSKYPAVPPNISGLLANPQAGDIITVINPPKILPSLHTPKGHHSGLRDTDLMVPVLLRGPKLEELYGLEIIWLHELFGKYLPEVAQARIEPVRERHSLTLQVALTSKPHINLETTLSPAYRLRFRGNVNADLRQAVLEYDIFSTFLTRWWLGVGLEQNSGQIGMVGQATIEARYNNLMLDYTKTFKLKSRDAKLSLAYLVADQTALRWTYPAKIGLSFYW